MTLRSRLARLASAARAADQQNQQSPSAGTPIDRAIEFISIVKRLAARAGCRLTANLDASFGEIERLTGAQHTAESQQTARDFVRRFLPLLPVIQEGTVRREGQ